MIKRFTTRSSPLILLYSSRTCVGVSSPVNTFSAPPPSCLPLLKPSLYFSCIFDCSVLSAHCLSAFSCCVACFAKVSVVCLSAFFASAVCVACLSALRSMRALRSLFVLFSALLSAFVASSAASASFVAAFCSSVFTLSALALVASVSPTACSCCLTSVFTLVLRSSSALLSAFVVSSVCSFAAIGAAAWLIAPMTCVCV